MALIFFTTSIAFCAAAQPLISGDKQHDLHRLHGALGIIVALRAK